MRFRFRKSHVYLLFVLILFAIGWLVLIRLDTKFNRSYSADFAPIRSKSGKWLNKFVTPVNLVNPRSSRIKDLAGSNTLGYQPISCLINNEHSIGCLKGQDATVWVPFNFVKRYFDIDGQLVKTLDGREYLNWEHSYSKIYRPKTPYDYRKSFLWFQNYNVEVRDRVKCISGSKSVPISTQWEPKGHFYPIQIAQFGLSHFSKNLTQGPPRVTVIEDGQLRQEFWFLEKPSQGNIPLVQSIVDESNEVTSDVNHVLSIKGDKVSFKFKRKKLNNDLILSMRLKASKNFSFTVYLISDLVKEFSVNYALNDDDFIDNENSYGVGATFEQWFTITRDVGVDLQKAYSVAGRKLPVKPRNLHVSRILFKGQALIDNVVLYSNAHEANFYAAVRWMVENQDRKGGWPIHATRKLCSGTLILPSGWYSAMAQGQGISLLTRMYHITKNETYLKSAIRALALFDMNSTVGGIRTFFLDKHVWFEEYPTVPSIYVLNGFIYSLFGLYDLKMTCRRLCPKAEAHFEDGLKSLKELLPLFDTGSGTLYDLRHFSLKIEPKPARWDYHSTHINQLLYLNTLVNESQFVNTSKRWISYMKGKRAPHN